MSLSYGVFLPKSFHHVPNMHNIQQILTTVENKPSWIIHSLLPSPIYAPKCLPLSRHNTNLLNEYMGTW